MWRTTCFTERLGLHNPIVLAPMAGVSTPKLVAAVSNAGGLGMYGAALTPARDLPRLVDSIRALLKEPGTPFGFNLFCPPSSIPQHTPQQEAALEAVHRVYADLAAQHNLGNVTVERPPTPDAAELHLAFRAQVKVGPWLLLACCHEGHEFP
jgi:nitronate monooxygenase